MLLVSNDISHTFHKIYFDSPVINYNKYLFRWYGTELNLMKGMIFCNES